MKTAVANSHGDGPNSLFSLKESVNFPLYKCTYERCLKENISTVSVGSVSGVTPPEWLFF
jgi:hypothetical protein